MADVNLSDLTEFVSRAIVSSPDDVEVEEQEEDGATVVKVQVHPQDVGRLIGRKGRTIDALRTLVDIAASASGGHGTVDVVEPERRR